ncbi:phosphatidylserine decarboxylase, partial [Candidatus Mycobacterium methanotrophicum]|uniref:phosphatidylserine decarboxylase n=1 Tax=Candidatus Mycobacterium methanotrophicum TaxID=2943498 RepID=UPI0021058D21
MVEVSSCNIHPNITAGYHIAKGEELGYFQFGGSADIDKGRSVLQACKPPRVSATTGTPRAPYRNRPWSD